MESSEQKSSIPSTAIRRQNIAIVTMESEQELVCDLSNGAISNDLERTLWF